jgi:hypothetical protein
MKMTGSSPAMTGWIVACGTSTARAVGISPFQAIALPSLWHQLA